MYNILTPTDKFFKFLLEKRQQSVVVSSSSPVSYKWGIEHGCSFFELRIALPDSTLVPTGRMQHLAPIGSAVVSADQLVGKTALTSLVPAHLGTPLKFLLYQIEHFRRDIHRDGLAAPISMSRA